MESPAPTFEMNFREPTPKLTELLNILITAGGSDLHIMTHTPPRVRIDGNLEPLNDFDPLQPAGTKDLIYSILSPDQIKRFEEKQTIDLSITVKGLSRFRVNVFDHRSGIGAVLRAIPFTIASAEELNVPQAIIELANKPRGLVLVTGPTGSGKSTTLASLIDKINRERPVNIITVEDPIEFYHTHQRAQVIQREVHVNTESFADATRAAVRQDPDIILIGELRDLETIEQAVRVAEMGHLTFGTLHTNTAASTITRIIDVFPANQQAQIRTQLSNVLIGVMCQQLIPKASGKGRIMAAEVMLPTPAIKNNIREDKIHQIPSIMSTGQDNHQMITLNQALARLVANKTVTFEAAAARSDNSDELQSKVGALRETEHSRVPHPAQLSQRPGVERRPIR